MTDNPKPKLSKWYLTLFSVLLILFVIGGVWAKARLSSKSNGAGSSGQTLNESSQSQSQSTTSNTSNNTVNPSSSYITPSTTPQIKNSPSPQARTPAYQQSNNSLAPPATFIRTDVIGPTTVTSEGGQTYYSCPVRDFYSDGSTKDRISKMGGATGICPYDGAGHTTTNTQITP